MIGKTLGHYQIVEKIGRGGMGEVFLAEDTSLHRKVALKFLPAEMQQDSTARKRLIREARSAAALDHPYICHINEVGAWEGRDYIAMEYVEGQSLKDRLALGSLPLKEALRIAGQAAEALEAAHGKGIIHRDIKPGNLMLTPAGHAKVMDFGLAKHLVGVGGVDTEQETETALTGAGAAVGTLAYMSPEQLRGQPADARSDLWGLGVTLYEMVAGVRPFEGRSSYELSSAILNRALPPLPSPVPAGIGAVICRCLEKEAGKRFQSASELREALTAVQSGTLSPWVGWRYRLGRRRWVGLAAVLAAALLALIGLDVGGWRERLAGGGASPSRTIKIAVLPFANLTGDPAQDYFSDGLTDEMIAQLGRLDPQRLSVIARTTAMVYKKTGKAVGQIGRELGVGYVLEGSARREGGRFRINVQLVRVKDQTQQWANSYERELEGILAVQSEVAQGVARSLAIALIPAEQARLSSNRVIQPAAYEQYQLGRYRLAERTVPALEAAIGHFERAVAIDPVFALAYAGLADSCVLLPFFSAKTLPAVGHARAVAAANRALALDPSLGQAHTVLALVREFEFQWDAAEGHFRRALALNPGYATAHHWYADMLARRGRDREAFAEIRKAIELDPQSSVIKHDLAFVLGLAGEQEAAMRELERMLEIDPAFSTGWFSLATAKLEAGLFEEASQALVRWAELTNRDPLKIRQLVDAAAAHARSGIPQLPPGGSDLARIMPPYAVPILLMHLGQREQALEVLESAYERGVFSTVSALVNPVFAGLREDPRFVALQKKTGLVIRDKP